MLALAWLAGFALLWLPGALVVRLLRTSTPDPISLLAFQCSTGFALLPILLLCSSTVGITLTTAVVRAILVTLLVLGLASILGMPTRCWRVRRRYLRRAAPFLALFLIVAALAVQTRIAHARGLALPPWVDPIHHTMITSLILEEGSLPGDFGRYIPGTPFAYHFGVHATLAALCSLVGLTDVESVAVLMLHFGQLLNALVLLTLYACAKEILRSHHAALLAASIGTLVSWFPAYYLSWGRYPHLGGVFLLTVIPALLRLARRRSAGNVVLVVILATGLVLTHVRVAFFVSIFVVVIVLSLIVKRRWAALGAWILCGCLTLILIAPFAHRVSRAHELMESITGTRSLTEDEAHRTIPPDHLWAPNNRLLLGVATGGLSEILLHRTPASTAAGIAWWLTLIALAERERRRRWISRVAPWNGVLLMAGWSATTAALLLIPLDRIPLTRSVSWSSAIITLFVPLSIAAAAILVWAIDAVTRRSAPTAVAIVIALVATTGAYRMQQVVNPATVLAGEDDLRAIRWMDRNLDSGDTVASEYRPWLGSAWIASGGAVWIPVLTRCQTLVPPAIYAWARDEGEVARIASTASPFSSLGKGGAARVARVCTEAGATHVYGTRFLPAAVEQDAIEGPQLRHLFSSGEIAIYEVVPKR